MVKPILGRAPRFCAKATQAIVDEGVARNSNHCMLAEAIKEAYPKLKFISVDIQTIRATDMEKRERYVWLTPRKCQVEIINFDRGIKPKPFQFELRDGQTLAAGKTYNEKKKMAKARLRKTKKSGGRPSVLERVGGKAPPRSIGQRRAYGLRKLEY
jgi:hypothetical protein